MADYTKTSIGNDARYELHDKLNLTGAEISINTLAPGTSVPIVHYHKKNEEIYGIISGRGKAVIDGETVDIKAGDWLKIAPKAKRQFFAAPDEPMTYICIQTKENSLEEFTMEDGVVEN